MPTHADEMKTKQQFCEPQPVQPAKDKLREIIAATYQILGAYDAPEHVLDVLANPELATQEQIDALLPFAQPVQPADDDELKFLRTKLKTGEYDGVDIMRAWLAIDQLIELRAFRAALAQPVQPASTAQPYAFAVYFPTEQREELAHHLDDLIDDTTNLEHTVTKLYDHPIAQPAPPAIEFAYNTFEEFLKLKDACDIADIDSARQGWNALAKIREAQTSQPVQPASVCKKCAVKDCENHKGEGSFYGLLCAPCHTFVSGDGGLYSQAYRNSRAMIDLAIQMERDRNTKLLYQMHERAAAHHNYYKHAAIEINRKPEEGGSV